MDQPWRGATPRRWLPVALGIAPALFVLVFYVRPVVEIIGLGLAPGGRLDLAAVGEVLGRSGLRRVIGFTVWQAVLSTVLTLAAALPITHLLATREFRGRSLLESALTVPFVLPTTVVGTAFLALLGPAGPLPGATDLSHSLTAILLAHVFFNVAVVVRVVGAFWSGMDPDLVAASRTLGASAFGAWRRVVLPVSVPAIASAASIVFLFTFTSLGVVLILGGPGLATLEVEILRQTRDLLNLPTAATLALVQLAAVALALVASGRWQQRSARQLPRGHVASGRRPLAGRRDRMLLRANLAGLALLIGAPLATLVIRSLRFDGRWSLHSWTHLGELRRGSLLATSPMEAIGNTIRFGVVAVVIALTLGALASLALARSRSRASAGLDALLALPLGTSAVTIGFGFLVALDSPPLDLRSSPVLVPIAHALVATPFVVRVLLPSLRALDPDQPAAARTLGAGPMRALLATHARTMAPAIATAAAFAFAISAGEFGATVFIARPESTTVPLAILRLLSQPGASSFGQAMVLSVVLLVLVLGVVLGVSRLGATRLGSAPLPAAPGDDA